MAVESDREYVVRRSMTASEGEELAKKNPARLMQLL
jgi:hypothetical protein